MEVEIAAAATPVLKRLSRSVEEVAGDGGEMIGVSNTKHAKVAVGDGGTGSGAIIGLSKTKGVVGNSGDTIIELPKAKPAVIPNRVKKSFLVCKKAKYIFENSPTRPIILNIPSEALAASVQRMIDLEKSVLKRFEMKGYAVYERGWRLPRTTPSMCPMCCLMVDGFLGCL
ncbi:hypothetical protein GQ55_6G280300 [Panicum hallii var. hallii]|uniref:Uncharacterized protein n=1 Tax=Panicum hallii var. hallii TaxID=1504633 RepID=A0A2T7DAH1_9POAL|nr:hypothetical protein GQ55_6G280300 [Panicum hallii var. hallii]